MARKILAFTILELATVIVVIGILITLLIPAFEVVRMRLDKAGCSSNLRSLYVAANAYIQQNGHWPQINTSLLSQPNNAYDEAWIEAFAPYGLSRNNWICPTTQRDMGGPDYNQPENYRADYVAMPYDIKPTTPYKWPTFPWFVEKGNVHGNGNLIVQSNGAVVELSQIVTPGASPSP
jgi:competence protein ComGC